MQLKEHLTQYAHAVNRLVYAYRTRHLAVLTVSDGGPRQRQRKSCVIVWTLMMYMLTVAGICTREYLNNRVSLNSEALFKYITRTRICSKETNLYFVSELKVSLRIE